MLISAACRAPGDDDAARMESAAARAGFERLGAGPDLAAGPAPGLVAAPSPERRHDRQALTARECEILRLVATGATNKAIAERLVLSDKTVARHVSNIFGKLGVSSRRPPRRTPTNISSSDPLLPSSRLHRMTHARCTERWCIRSTRRDC